MKIALHNYRCGEQVAETELARRLTVAARRLGWSAIEVGTSGEINSLKPDFVLALHFRTPKLTPFPTYGCLWSPPSWAEQDPSFSRNISTYDAYLTSSDSATDWIRGLLDGLPKPPFLAPIYTSCPARPWRAPSLESPRLVYLGANWDGQRHGKLFIELAELPFVDLYGPTGSWDHAGVAYRGPLPFDGESVLDVLNRSGVGLCFHSRDHRQAGLPSSRIFEIVASGAVAICEEHPFIRKKFGDAVLYLDEGLEPTALAAQINSRFEWIAANPEKASNMSRRAHAVFEKELSLEILLKEIGRRHDELIREKNLSKSLPTRSREHYESKR